MDIKSINTLENLKTIKVCENTELKENKSNDDKISGTDLAQMPQMRDLVTFKALKKSQFKGVDLAVVEKFRAPIQNFAKIEQLQAWAEANFYRLSFENVKSNTRSAYLERKKSLKEWFGYLEKGNDAYSNALKLLIFSSVLGSIKEGEDDLPPSLNKGVLAQTVSDLQVQLDENPKKPFDFIKMYKSNLKKSFLEEQGVVSNSTGWIKIPSKKNDPYNFKENVKKLQLLSHKNWCTKTFNAEPYLADGDFHIYIDNGKPKLGVRFEGDNICEVQGELNNSKIPADYLETFKQHINENNYVLKGDAHNAFEEIEIILPMINNAKENLGSALELNSAEDVQKVLDFFEYKYEKNDDNLFILPAFERFKGTVSLQTLGCDIQKLLDYIVRIDGDADFSDMKIEKFRTLKEIKGNVLFDKQACCESLGSIEKIGGDLVLKDCCVEKLGNLKYIGGNFENESEYLSGLGKLEEIGGNIDFSQFEIERIKRLKKIGGNADFEKCRLISTGSLKSIGGTANFVESWIEDLGVLEFIGGNMLAEGSEIGSLCNLKTVKGYVDLLDSKIESLGALETVGRDLDCFNCKKLRAIPNLKKVGGNVDVQGTGLSEYDFANVEIGGEISDDYSSYEDDF